VVDQSSTALLDPMIEMQTSWLQPEAEFGRTVAAPDHRSAWRTFSVAVKGRQP
jgi:hypothetical protein